MELLFGFLIAFAIAITGVGAGTVTAPALVLFLHVPLPIAVGTALVYASVVKLIVVPVQIIRNQVVWKILGMMLVGGLPGVLVGVVLFRRVVGHGFQAPLYFALGSIIVFASGLHFYKAFRARKEIEARKERRRWLAFLMLPIGAELGFSSSGAGALGTVALLGLTNLTATEVVGTDLAFGLCLSILGGGLHLLVHTPDTALLWKLLIGGVAGAIAGTLVAPRLPHKQLRLVLTAWLLLIGLQFCYQAVRPPADASQHEKRVAVSGAVQNAMLSRPHSQ
ncbi:MAG TPA: sulfite exporter TauE/SafE family protein [Pseudacidobacterium sp.]|nr:sulfite exporter TauE/SafE family protein [Pseudacidobacterium sp.]